ncbi:hypothetical protein [Actinomadura fibrosa]|uniref:Uncharacterized protein n=1 Tax=Actinomadura fibrosa TaxID=111802 RepID=A0ABW2XKI5_9ACTN|nr:hypothetical protein [Actinomadura fibrosa]
MEQATHGQGRLAALAAHLAAHRLDVDLTGRGLRVSDPRAPGCCEHAREAADTITCRARAEDDGALWFYTSWQEPIAQADRVTEATVFILGYLARAAEGAR